MLEDSLREMFAARVESTPPIGDVATQAIRRGRAIRRRRAAVSSAAAAIAMVMTVGTISSLGGWGRGDEHSRSGSAIGFTIDPEAQATSVVVSTPGPDNGIGLDLRAGDRLWTSDGRELRLTGVGKVLRSYRVPDGWVYGGATNVRFLRLDGTSIALSGEQNRWVVSPEGDRIAFAIGTTLYVADLRASGLAVRASRDIPPAATPVAFVGDRVAVSVGSLGLDLLDPAGTDPPAWNPDVVTVYGSYGEVATGLIRNADQPGLCVAQLSRTSTGLQSQATGVCDLAVTTSVSPPRLAPGGTWLAVPKADGVDLIDLTRSSRGQHVVVPCQVRSRVAPAWADARTLVTADGQGVVRCGTDGSRRTVTLPEGVTAGWELVPKFVTPASS